MMLRQLQILLSNHFLQLNDVTITYKVVDDTIEYFLLIFNDGRIEQKVWSRRFHLFHVYLMNDSYSLLDPLTLIQLSEMQIEPKIL